jgi:hypothetical protein
VVAVTTIDMTEFEPEFDGYFTDDQPPKVGVLALVAVGCWVAVGVVGLLVVGAVRGACRWVR